MMVMIGMTMIMIVGGSMRMTAMIAMPMIVGMGALTLPVRHAVPPLPP